MTEHNDPRCFTCRQLVEEPPVLNHLANGRACPACQERVLDSLPSLLPSSPVDVEIEEESEETEGQGPRSLILVDSEADDAFELLDDPPQPA